MAKHTLKILRCEHRNVIKVCLDILQHYACKGYAPTRFKWQNITDILSLRLILLRVYSPNLLSLCC